MDEVVAAMIRSVRRTRSAAPVAAFDHQIRPEARHRVAEPQKAGVERAKTRAMSAPVSAAV